MLEFPEGYFQDEEREGFLVDATMKTVWAAELEVLNEVACVCAGHGLQWYAAYGTLLGAVRHQGFIPWDDDIDIWVKRDDYRQLVELLPKELPKEYVVRPPHAREGYPEYQVYVNNGDSISIEPDRLQRFHGCPFYVGIDIFPLDDIPATQEDIEIQRSIFAGTLMVQQLEFEAKQNGSRAQTAEQVAGLLDVLRSRYGILIDRKLLYKKNKAELLTQLWQAAERLSDQKKGKSRQTAMYLDYLKYGKVFEKVWFDEVDYLPFEGFDMPVPSNYDAVLRAIYGDYTVCVRSNGMHDYPCYKRQLEELRRKVEEHERRGKYI